MKDLNSEIYDAINSLISAGAQYQDEVVSSAIVHNKTREFKQKLLTCDLRTGKFGLKLLGKISFLKRQGIPVKVIKAGD